MRKFFTALLAFAVFAPSAQADSGTVTGFVPTGTFRGTATITIHKNACDTSYEPPFQFCGTFYTAYALPTAIPCTGDKENWLFWVHPFEADRPASTYTATVSVFTQTFGAMHLCLYQSGEQSRDPDIVLADLPVNVTGPSPSVDQDCAHFPSQWAAQDFMEAYGDSSGLDDDNDQVACEYNDEPRRGPSPHPWPVERIVTPPPPTPTAPVAKLKLSRTAARRAAKRVFKEVFGRRYTRRARYTTTSLVCKRSTRVRYRCRGGWFYGRYLDYFHGKVIVRRIAADEIKYSLRFIRESRRGLRTVNRDNTIFE